MPDETAKSDAAPASESTETAPELEDGSEAAEYPSFVIPRESREPEVAVEPDVTVAESSVWSIARIENVAVEEGRGGVLVTVVASDGTEATKSATPTEGGVELAVVRATAALVNAESPDPIVVDIEDRRIEGVDLVIVVLNVNGKLVTGSSVVAAGRPFALGRATWAALAL